jgi:hypothetical protein
MPFPSARPRVSSPFMSPVTAQPPLRSSLAPAYPGPTSSIATPRVESEKRGGVVVYICGCACVQHVYTYMFPSFSIHSFVHSFILLLFLLLLPHPSVGSSCVSSSARGVRRKRHGWVVAQFRRVQACKHICTLANFGGIAPRGGGLGGRKGRFPAADSGVSLSFL